jgi:hypothetical protein
MSRVSAEKVNRKFVALLLSLAGLAVLILAPSAQAAFGIEEADLTFTKSNGLPAIEAGTHPYAVTNFLAFNTANNSHGEEFPDGAVRDVRVKLPEGLVGEPGATPRCSGPNFIDIDYETKLPNCSNSAAVGAVSVKVILGPGKPQPAEYISAPVYNLIPPPGVVQKLGFSAYGVPVTIEFTINPNPPYNILVNANYVAHVLPFLGTELTVWGNPASPVHDSERGSCVLATAPKAVPGIVTTGASCPTNIAEKPFVTLPRACSGPLATTFQVDSWQNPGVFTAPLSIPTHDDATPPNPQGFVECGQLGFNPTIASSPTTKAAQSPTGLDFSLDVHDEGLTSSTGIANSDIKRAVVTLPEGMSTNPSLAEGLNVCTEADLDRESVNSEAGAGCPNASKIGSVEVETPLLDQNVNGSLFIAKPYENPFGSLLALYMVIRNPTLGIIVKQPLKVENDPVTGRITTVADNLPQLPFSHFKLHFREGTRSPLASPPLCGTYNASAVLTPWAGGAPITTNSAFSIISGPNASGCPSGTSQPFKPSLEAGTQNNAAGRYSPFYLRMSRTDGEQEITHFSIKLPPGVSGKLAGIPFCSDAAITAAKARTGPHGGEEEINAPSCPKASEVGRTLAGAGVGPSLAYAPGKVYLAGPYHGSAMSIAAITAVKVGPFDLGTVVIRSALKVNPETAEVFVDATGSDPIPHIIKGIPVHLRDIRVYVDKPDFVLNPTSCEKTSTASTVLGSGSNFASEADDAPVTVTSPFQAADCASLGFGPKLDLSLKGGTKRGDTPAFKAVLTARKGDANIGKAQVTLPHSEFLEQAHIGTVCTRPQFKAGETPGEKCPAASVYGYAKAITPLLDEPLEGPVYLRSSSHPLPDLVAALNSGKIDIALAGRIDSVQNGHIRNTFEAVPDAPVTKFTLTMQGGKKGLLVNSANLCKGTNRAIADFTGQNGKKHVFNPVLKAQGCSKAKKKKAKAKAKAKRSSVHRILSSW